MATLSADVLQDDIAVSLARVMATANKRARELGMDVVKSFITITQQLDMVRTGELTMDRVTTSIVVAGI